MASRGPTSSAKKMLAKGKVMDSLKEEKVEGVGTMNWLKREVKTLLSEHEHGESACSSEQLAFVKIMMKAFSCEAYVEYTFGETAAEVSLLMSKKKNAVEYAAMVKRILEKSNMMETKLESFLKFYLGELEDEKALILQFYSTVHSENLSGLLNKAVGANAAVDEFRAMYWR